MVGEYAGERPLPSVFPRLFSRCEELAELEGIGSSSSNSEKAEDLVSDDSQSEDSVDSDNVSTTYSSSS